MFKNLRDFDSVLVNRQVLTPYSALSSFPSSSESTYKWIFGDTGGAMPPLARPGLDPPSKAYLMGSPESEVKSKIKCVLVGDGSVGKTSLIVSYTTNGYPTEYVPTAFDNYNVMVTVDNQPIRLQLCDTAGQDDFDSLRPLCYPGTDIFLVCFSVVSPTSFYNVKEKWLPELRQHHPKAPLLLVGTQSDLRTDVKVLIELAQYREQPVSEAAARKLAQQIGAVSYIESSALTQRNLKEVFDRAILAAFDGRDSTPSLSKKGGKRSSSRHLKKMEKVIEKSNGNGSPISLRYDEQYRCPNVVDYNDNEGRKRGWRKLCCLS